MCSEMDDICHTITAGRLLRQRIKERDFMLAPGVYDGFSARIALEVGFNVLYMVSLLYSFVSEFTSDIV